MSHSTIIHPTIVYCPNSSGSYDDGLWFLPPDITVFDPRNKDVGDNEEDDNSHKEEGHDGDDDDDVDEDEVSSSDGGDVDEAESDEDDDDDVDEKVRIGGVVKTAAGDGGDDDDEDEVSTGDGGVGVGFDITFRRPSARNQLESVRSLKMRGVSNRDIKKLRDVTHDEYDEEECDPEHLVR